ncbi:MAG: exosortase C-terminal domain/associated protein EpsI, partial [Myxococcota bacterium]
ALALSLLTLLLGVFAYRSLLVWSPTEGVLPRLEGWLYMPSGTSPQIVLALAAAALVARRDRLLAALGPAGSLGQALAPLGLGGVLFLWASYVGAMDLLIPSLASLALGAGLLLGGAPLARELALPLLILLFAIPSPAVLTNQIVFPLQLLTAEHTLALVRALGVPAVQSGDLLYTPGHTVRVIETCSGMRSIDVLTLLALVYAAFFRPGARRGVLLVVAAPLIAYGINLVRVALMVLRPGSPSALAHVLEGVAVFGAGVLLLLLTDAGLSRLLPHRRSQPAAHGPDLPTPSAGRRSLAVLAAVAVSLAAASLLVPSWVRPDRLDGSALKLPAEAHGWRLSGRTPAEEARRPWSGGATRHAYGSYERDGEAAAVFVAVNHRLRRNQSLLSPRNAFPGAGWEVEERTLLAVGPDGPRVEVTLLGGLKGRVLTYHWYEGTARLAGELTRALLATDRSPLRRPGAARMVQLSTGVEPKATGRAEAEARLRSLLPAFGVPGPAS